jgi:hypothetical protein
MVCFSTTLVENAVNGQGTVALNVCENIDNLCFLEISEKKLFEMIKNKKNGFRKAYQPPYALSLYIFLEQERQSFGQ